MATPALVRAVRKLAMAGEQAGFSLEQMIDMLNAGLSVLVLLELISWRLELLRTPAEPLISSSRWIM
ncbi:MAG TPA: hypothetical protein VJQ82_16215 [Terriglobales bacterium]|nr:hypothetical protein [Terriglobales bacterium]